jgi:hypothetical protein
MLGGEAAVQTVEGIVTLKILPERSLSRSSASRPRHAVSEES